LSAIPRKCHHGHPGWLPRGMTRVFRRSFNPSNRFSSRSSEACAGGVYGVIRRKASSLGVYALLLAATIGISQLVPGGFVPAQDKQYLIGFTQLPNGASLDRTEDVIRRMTDIALKEPGVASAIAFPGLSINGFTNSSSAGIVF